MSLYVLWPSRRPAKAERVAPTPAVTVAVTTRMLPSRLRTVVLVGALAVALASCGGSGSGATGDVIVTLKDFSLTATPGTFAAGSITFGIDSQGPSVHEFVVLRTDDAPGTSSSLDVNLDAGAYVLVCNLPAHYEQGMFAAFTVA